MRKLLWIASLGVLLASLCSGLPASAQTAATGAVLGTVTDPQQAAVEGATVEMRNVGTNEVRTQTTNSAGQYSFPGVMPGVYKISVTRIGACQRP
jgi:protocatechuate 3,4-dioxygenase beta subunit